MDVTITATAIDALGMTLQASVVIVVVVGLYSDTYLRDY